MADGLGVMPLRFKFRVVTVSGDQLMCLYRPAILGKYGEAVKFEGYLVSQNGWHGDLVRGMLPSANVRWIEFGNWKFGQSVKIFGGHFRKTPL